MIFEPYLARWDLTPDGAPIITRSGSLLPVSCNGTPAMLKVATEAEEKWGAVLMVWWEGEGAARVFAHEGDALLLERATGEGSLIAMARNGRDDDASRIICAVAARLHARKDRPLPELIPLPRWFQELEPAAQRYGGVLNAAAATARELLAEPRGIVALHGDLHHGNILDFGPRGWLAIDPKRLLGDCGFEFANIFCNPDFETATVPERLPRQVGVVAEAAGLDRTRLLKWILAYAGLSAAWTLGDGCKPDLALAVAERAAKELAKVNVRRGKDTSVASGSRL